MSYGDSGIRDVLMNHLSNMCQITDAVVDKINLTITRHLKVDGISNNLRTKSMNLCLNRIAIGRRCLDNTQVSSAD